MPTTTQPAAFQRLAAKLSSQAELEIAPRTAQTMVGQIRTQFAHRGFVSVSEVAIACNISCRTVLAWLQQGLVEGLNVGSKEKPYYRIFAPSVVGFFEKRSRES